MTGKTCFVFCHGFGFDATFWNPLRPFFSNMNAIYLDLGYFDTVSQSVPVVFDGVNYIGIGHSLGLMKLISLHVAFKRLIGLHGFVNFLGFNPQLHRRRQRELNQLTTQFNNAPERTLAQFYQRTGVDFICQFNQPVILVASSRLGTINHTLLSLEALRARNLNVLGIIVTGDANEDLCRSLEEYGQTQMLGQLPFLPKINKATLGQVPLGLTLTSILER